MNPINPNINPNIGNIGLMQNNRLNQNNIYDFQSINHNRLSKLNLSTLLSLATLFILLVTLFFTYRIHSLISEPVTKELKIVSVLNNLSKITNIPPATLPNQVNIIGDGILPKIDDLRKIGPIQEEVFKNAQDGDYVLVYAGANGAPDRMIIYRESTNTIIYDGKTVATLDQENRTALLNRVIEAAKKSNLIPSDYSDLPIAQVVADSVKFKQENDLAFFRDVQNGDIIATFKPSNGQSLILIYRPATNTITKIGYQTITSK
ncbi:MAG: hypothetical protein NZZ41_05685 [Candidatus Dojkabacteria bacterium]|nr:hypothetical protein [Candidatus Dojkabacteria bacterium]